MFAPTTKALCQDAVFAEMSEACKTNPPFNSLHEGWAVMKEEFEEAQDELEKVNLYMGVLWKEIKADTASPTEILEIRHRAINAMMESAQLAAMATKMLAYMGEL